MTSKRVITESEFRELLEQGWEVRGKLRAKGVTRQSLARRRGGRFESKLVEVVPDGVKVNG